MPYTFTKEDWEKGQKRRDTKIYNHLQQTPFENLSRHHEKIFAVYAPIVTHKLQIGEKIKE